MTYRLPPLAGLRAFEAAARHMSFRRAADELCVTAGAVSQHVKTLEDALGVPLFRRLARSVELTAAGKKYLPTISAAFEMISEATETSAPALRGWKLRVGIAPAVQKLDIPAVSGLLSPKAHKQVIGLAMPDEPAQVAEGRVHALLRLSDKSCGGLHIERIKLRNGTERVPTVLVARPGLAGCRQHRTLVKLLHGWR
jgi:LysR family transcriptional regulator, glycine cleavage system transcriptional activator